MGRPKRAVDGGLVYHVLNRATARMSIFADDEDYAAFEQVLEETAERTQIRLLAYCVLPNHWHLVIWPREDGELSRFTGWLTLTHTQRWHAHRRSTGSGHVYQGRFKSFPVQQDEHFYTVCRYVERNALRANLAPGAERCRLGQSASLETWYGEGKVVVGGLALAALAGLGRARQRPANGRGVGGAAALRTARIFWRAVLVRPNGTPAGLGKHASPPRPP